MAVQSNNLLLLDASGIARIVDTANDSISVGVPFAFGGDVSVGGNLSVTGDVISHGAQNMVVGDGFIDLNSGNTSTGASKAGGLAVNVRAANVASTVVAFAAGVALTSDAAFSILSGSGSSTYAVGDIVEISGCTTLPGNNGLFVVVEVNDGKDVNGDVSALQSQILVAGLSTAMPVNAPFAQNQFTAGTASASAYRVNLAVVAFSDGNILAAGDSAISVGNMVSAYAASAWVGAGAAPSGRTKLYYGSAQNVSLQEAYNVGATISMTAAKGAFDVSFAEGEYVGFSLDGASASNVTVDGADLTLSTATYGNIVINSAGDIDADAVSITLDGTAASSFMVAGADLTLSTWSGSGNVVIASADAIDVDAVAGVTIDAAGISLDSSAASNFTVDGAELTLGTVNSGELDLTSAGLLDINAGANLDIDITGTLDILASGALSIDGTGASNLSATSGNLTLSTLTSGNLVLASAGNVDVDGSAITVDATAGISLDAAGASNFSVAGAALTLETTGSGNVDINSAGDILADGAGISLDGTAASNFTVTGNSLTLSTVTSGELDLTSAGLLDINAGANADIDVTGNIEIDATGLVSIAGASASDITIAAQLTLETTAGGANLVLTSAASIDVNAANTFDVDALNVTIDASAGGISLDATDGSNFTVTGGNLMIQTNVSGDLQLWSVGAVDVNAITSITLDAAAASNFTVDGADLTLSTTTSGDLVISSVDDIVLSGDKAKFDATPVEFGSYAGVSVTLGEAFASAGRVGCWQNDGGTPKFFLAANDDVSDDKRVVAAVAQASGSEDDAVLAASVPGTLVPCSFASGPAAADVGKPVYLGTSGQVTLTAPTAGGTTVYRVGYLASGSAVSGLYSVLFAPQFIAKRP